MCRNFLFFILISNFIWAQKTSFQDPKYLEDQFYIGVSYNFVFKLPEGVRQSNFSYGLQGGFIKDIPLNANRNIGLGVGLGYAINNYYQNLKITRTNGNLNYALIPNDVSFKRNKIEMHLLEIPITLRWRMAKNLDWTGTDAQNYKFFRIYTGVKLGYVIGNRSKFIGDKIETISNLNSMQKFQYGLVTTLGYNNWNFNVYYGLNNLFKPNTTYEENRKSVEFLPLRVGLIFYIL